MKKKLSIILRSTLATVLCLAATVYAATTGTEDNPLVTKSYVDEKITELKALISTGDSTAAPVSQGSSYEPVYVSVGQTIYGGEGTELILRAGKGNVVISGADGIVDASTGTDLKGGAVTKNHILIVPRDDNRGVKVTEAAWFLVKGDYRIV